MPKVAFKQCDVERMLRAARAAGYEHPSIEQLPDGRLRLLTATPAPASAANEDDDLAGELETWAKDNGLG